ncbi:PadR family transcriptional regulator [Planomicrobium sp. MB-3u-38]|uniref:PadR family transcriptional regulator n=1 Tax=Planomicrobium sp. MB-3u-38 TaxID=2058318 RepID=UPI000C7ACD92|nr:PadR family transcriptional regulator [Planomicrobium sp. MB-3u-38]PKH11330.1 PadR family transcriptional regulator [Planomicrobium sp. MB-3u-38]
MERSAMDGWPGDLRSGVLALAVLSQLKEPRNSANLIRILEQRGLLENFGTLAPMLRQLEKQKLLLGDWDGARDGPQKYYTLSEKGADTFSQMTEEWRKVAEELQKLIEGDGSDDID